MKLKTVRILLTTFSLSLIVCLGANFVSAQTAQEEDPANVILMRPVQPFFSDLPEIQNRRILRVLVNYSQTNFFIAKGEPKGFEYELLKEYEKYLNRGIKDESKKTIVVFIPAPFGSLLRLLNEGRGDVIAAGMTVTPERLAEVEFTKPYFSNVNEVLVSSKTAPQIKQMEDLSGRTIYAAAGSSYVQHLKEINRELDSKQILPISIEEVSLSLSSEDLLELLNAGIINYIATDQHIAELWAQAFKDITVHHNIAVHSGGSIAWAVRKNNPELREHLSGFIRQNKKGTTIGNILFRRYYKNQKWITNPVSSMEKEKLEQYRELFEKYGEKYNFDWLKLAALAYQESGLNQNKRSGAGAIGIMQVRPRTAQEMGIGRIQEVEQNIHAGVKYLDHLRKNYFDDLAASPAIQFDFTLVAYNAGPTRVKKWRARAVDWELDPSKWFNNVERVALNDVGRETVRYVGNVNKYYIAYKLAYGIVSDKERAAETISAHAR